MSCFLWYNGGHRGENSVAIFRAFFIGVLCWTVCMPVFGEINVPVDLANVGTAEFKLPGDGFDVQKIKELKLNYNPVGVQDSVAQQDKSDLKGTMQQVSDDITRHLDEKKTTEQTEASVREAEEQSDEDPRVVEEMLDQGNDGIQAAEDKYKAAKEKEQSLANRMVSGVSMAATGIGGMELAQGLSEQKADKDAEADMSRYIETFQCRIGEQGAKINGGDTNISTPGANQLINLYQEYVNLAADLRERKQALGMRAGIESEVILDKASTGLYDDKGTGIENGTYASLYRASQGNQQDADKLSALKDTSKKRVIGGAVAAGAGVVVGALGDSLINGKLGELIKDAKDKKVKNKENESAVAELKKGLTSAGFTNVDKLDFSNLDLSGLSGKLQDIDWGKVKVSGDRDATQILNTTNAKSFISSVETMLGQSGK